MFKFADVKSESPASMTDKIFAQLDKDKDGRVSKEEFIEGSSANPSIISILSQTEKWNNFQHNKIFRKFNHAIIGLIYGLCL